MSKNHYRWYARGDVNAFFGLMLDNIADLILTVSLLAFVFGFPVSFALNYMVPGTAIGVLIGDLLFFIMALRLAKRTGRNDVTAMPLGLDTPSTFGMVFFVLGPAFIHAKTNLQLDELAAATYTWHIGICSIVISGLFKFACAFGSGWIRRIVPRAGLLGSLAAIALVIISFLPLLEILRYPVVGFAAMAVILTVLVGRIPLPGKIPGALGGLLVGGAIYYLMKATGYIEVGPPGIDPQAGLMPTDWLEVFRFEWLGAMKNAAQYLPVVIPFALATVIGGIDCTESAAAAGDDYDTRKIIGVEALATVVAGMCGGVIQTTPYIGHPAYKAMGGRAGYAIATALFVGSAGILGYFGYLYLLIPKAAVFPILVFIGLEITAQSFHATPRKHFPAVALSCVPALGYLVVIFVGRIFGDAQLSTEAGIAGMGNPELREDLMTVKLLANGFIVTSVIWASALAAIIDRRLRIAATYFAIAALFTLFGIMHSPFDGNKMFIPTTLSPELSHYVFQYVAGYAIVAALMFGWSFTVSPDDKSALEETI